MIDIHAHVLPGVDDGPTTMAEATRMCRLAGQDGIDTIIVTPHQRHEQWLNGDGQRLDSLRRRLQAEIGPYPRLLPGAEIAVDSQLLSELERPDRGNLFPLADSRYLLIELDPAGLGPDPVSLVHELVIADWIPILAHPERMRWLVGDLDLTERLVERGALLQITAMSVTGGFGKRSQARCRTLLDAGFVHFVASDMHGADRRPPGLGLAFREIAARWGIGVARRLTQDNARAVLEGRHLLEHPTVRPANYQGASGVLASANDSASSER